MEVSHDNYTKEYYLTDCEGYDEYLQTGGEKITGRLKKALDMAGIKEGMRILDIGTGRGEILIQCAKRGAEAFGLDYAEASIHLTREITEDKERAFLVRASASEIPFRDRSFDRVFFLDVVEHLTPGQLDKTYAEARRVLAPGGRIVIHTAPNKWAMDIGYPVKKALNNLVAAIIPKGLAKRVFGHPIARLKPDGRKNLGDYQHVHVNEQTYFSIRKQLKRRGLDPRISLLPEHTNVGRFGKLTELWPLSKYPPLNYIFAVHLWVLATPGKKDDN